MAEEIFYRSEKEQQRVEAFIRERRSDFEREQLLNAISAERKGETYQEQEFPGVDKSEALAAVRAGWKSKLEIAFAKKYQREAKGKHGGVLLTEDQINRILR